MIRADTSGPIWTLTLDRPDKANALTEQMLADLVDLTKRAQTARAVILTGVGKVFSAGADLDAAKAGLATSPLWEELSGAIAALPGLTITALNGTVAGGANGMVLACDLRIAVPQAKVFYPVMKLGYLPQPSDPVRMSALIGPARTKMILVAGQKIDAATAQSYGMFDEVVADGDVLARARGLCADVISAETDTAHAIKAMCP